MECDVTKQFNPSLTVEREERRFINRSSGGRRPQCSGAREPCRSTTAPL